MPVEKRNIFLQETRNALPFVAKRGRSGTAFPVRANPGAHAAFITRKLTECRNQDLTQRQVAAIRYKDGLYLEFYSAENSDLHTKALDNYRSKSGIRLLNIQQDGNVTRATVYVPAGKENYFLERVQAFSDSLESLEENKSPKNNDLVRSIEDVKLAVLESFWVGRREDMPDETAVWCEVWLRYENGQTEEAMSDFDECCSELKIVQNPRSIIFPERIVRLIQANHEQLVGLLTGCNYLAELRRAPESTSFFDGLGGSEQAEWVDELLGRTTFHNTDATVCILDTGLTAGRPLIAPATREEWVQSVDPAWRTSDHDGHGTEMAGIALYSDLKDALISGQPVDVYHQLESVKLLPPRGENSPDLYGAVTEQAVALAEIANPDAKRICRLMKQLDLKVDYSTKYNFTPYKKNPYYVNRLDRQFRPDAPNTVWVSDITMIRIGQGLLFLCPVMDLYARKIISYTVSEYMYSDIVIDALTKAYIARGCPQNLLFHSDQGTQFTAYHVKLMMRKQKVTLSYSNCGCPYDNAVGESFFATMKKEFVHRAEFENKEDFYAELQEYINFYNDHRPHSTIGYLAPSKAEDDYFSTHKTA